MYCHRSTLLLSNKDAETQSLEEGEIPDETAKKTSKKTFYEPKKSFFDSISCEATDKNTDRIPRFKERKLNSETFGIPERSRNYGNYRGGHYRNNNNNNGYNNRSQGGYNNNNGQNRNGGYQNNRQGGSYSSGNNNNSNNGQAQRGGYNNNNRGGYQNRGRPVY